MSAAGGVEPFLERYAVVLCADHGQSPIDRDDDVRDAFADMRLFRGRARTDPGDCDLAVAASNRAGHVYRLASRIPLDEIAERLLTRPRSTSPPGARTGTPSCRHAGRELRFAPDGPLRDAPRRRVDGRGRPRDARTRGHDGTLVSATYPNALERLWQILGCVNAGDVVASAAPGYEFRDAGGASHIGGGSHGSLHAVDSLVPLAAVGLQDAPALPGERSIEDIAALCAGHLGIGTW